MTDSFINQILNNFLEVSKFYIKVSEISTGTSTLYTLPNYSEISITTSPPKDIPYMVFNDARIIKMAVNSQIEKVLINLKSLSKTELILLSGAIDVKNKNSTLSQFLSEMNYYAISYLSSEIQKDQILFSFALHRLGLTSHAISILEKIEDEKAKVFLSKIYREKNNLKKSLELLSSIKLKELEPYKNLEYAWLHLQTGKPQNSLKIFEYYKNINTPQLRQEVLYGLARSLYEIAPENIKESLKLLEEAQNIEGLYTEEILKNIASIYAELKDTISTLKIYQKIYYQTLNINLLQQIIELAKKNNQNIELIHDLALFKPEDAKKLSTGATIPANTYVVNEPQNKNTIVESILAPEDITKASKRQSNITHDFFVDLTSTTKPDQASPSDIIETRAFEFTKQLEGEFSKKIYFNLDGIDDIERKVRITLMSEIREDEIVETLSNSSFFLLYMIRERFKAKINIYEGLDIWTATATIKNKKRLELITYPSARIWKFKWQETKPTHGYLRNYIEYLNSFMNMEEEPPYGKIAITKGIKSHEQKIFDAQIEHKKILEIAKDINETSYLTPNSSLLNKFEKELRRYFKPQIPPTVDGWKILRCFAHIFLEMVLKDFSPEWFCVEKNDGLWSFILPNKTYIFPIGKVYKAALTGESLEEYYNILRKNLKNK